MVKPGVTILIDKVAGVAEASGYLASQRVMVGIPQEKDPRDEGGSIGNAALGYIHENGAPEVNIPARPWLVPGIKEAQPRIVDTLGKAGTLAMDGNRDGAERALMATGLIGQNAAKAKIGSNIPPPLAPATLAARKRRGVSRTNTLIDTGEMQGAVTFVIRRV